MTRAPRLAVNRRAPLSADHRTVLVSGMVDCTGGRAVALRVRLTQPESGALAEGHWQQPCDGVQQGWSVDLVTVDRAFMPGRAELTVVDVTDATVQWLGPTRLVAPCEQETVLEF